MCHVINNNVPLNAQNASEREHKLHLMRTVAPSMQNPVTNGVNGKESRATISKAERCNLPTLSCNFSARSNPLGQLPPRPGLHPASKMRPAPIAALPVSSLSYIRQGGSHPNY